MSEVTLFKWQLGRQGTGYYKFPLLLSQKLKADLYILKYPAGSSIPIHTDKVSGYRHYRMNLTFWGDYKAVKLSGSPIFRLWRFYFFRPDVTPHSVEQVKSVRLVLSLGWLK